MEPCIGIEPISSLLQRGHHNQLCHTAFKNWCSRRDLNPQTSSLATKHSTIELLLHKSWSQMRESNPLIYFTRLSHYHLCLFGIYKFGGKYRIRTYGPFRIGTLAKSCVRPLCQFSVFYKWWARSDSNQLSLTATDLQSAPTLQLWRLPI